MSISTICPHDCWPNLWNRISMLLLIPTKSNHNGSVAGTNQVLLAPQRLYVSIMRSVLPEDKSFAGWRMAWWFSPVSFSVRISAIWGRFEVFRCAGGKPSRWFWFAVCTTRDPWKSSGHLTAVTPSALRFNDLCGMDEMAHGYLAAVLQFGAFLNVHQYATFSN